MVLIELSFKILNTDINFVKQKGRKKNIKLKRHRHKKNTVKIQNTRNYELDQVDFSPVKNPLFSLNSSVKLWKKANKNYSSNSDKFTISDIDTGNSSGEITPS